MTNRSVRRRLLRQLEYGPQDLPTLLNRMYGSSVYTAATILARRGLVRIDPAIIGTSHTATLRLRREYPRSPEGSRGRG